MVGWVVVGWVMGGCTLGGWVGGCVGQWMGE